MEASSSVAFRRNLEPFETERRLGNWRISGYADHVSERRFLLSSIRTDPSAPVDAETIAFRAAAASTITPAVLPVVDVLVDRGRLELLSAWADPIEPATTSDETLRDFLAQLLDAVAALERSEMEISELGVAAIARKGDGTLGVLPCVCALPPLAMKKRATAAAKRSCHASTASRVGAVSRMCLRPR